MLSDHNDKLLSDTEIKLSVKDQEMVKKLEQKIQELKEKHSKESCWACLFNSNYISRRKLDAAETLLGYIKDPSIENEEKLWRCSDKDDLLKNYKDTNPEAYDILQKKLDALNTRNSSSNAYSVSEPYFYDYDDSQARWNARVASWRDY